MRRITRLRRPSGLSAKINRSPIAPLAGQSPSVSSHNISTSPRRPIPTATSLQSPAFARLYSTDKQPPTPQDASPKAAKTQEGEQLKTPLERLTQAAEDSKSLVPAAPTSEVVQEAVDEDPEPQWTSFVPPVSRRVYTERADQVSDTTYVPALTDAGLKVVGGTKGWWEKREHWRRTADFVGFRPRVKAREPAILEATVRRAVVEAYALRQAGREEALVAKWPVKGTSDLRTVLQVNVTAKPDGSVTLEGDVEAVLKALDGEEPDQAAKRPVLKDDELAKYMSAWGNDWKAISLADPRIKFAVTKRIFQLTGHLIQDFKLSGINSVQTLLHVVQKPPKPKTLTEEIQEKRQDLVELPNVFVATKRITRGDKEKAVGRYKLIEEEYKKRELPLIGHGYAPNNSEIPRLKGDL